MPITYKENVAMLQGHCEIEEAETLLTWLFEHPQGEIDLKQVEHIHAAILQVLMALKPVISAWPDDDKVEFWLVPALNGEA